MSKSYKLDTTLWTRLVAVQNRMSLVYCVPVDILSIVSFMKLEQAEKHCAYYESEYPAK